MKRILIILIIACGWLSSSLLASNSPKSHKDSLLRIYLASPADTTRLKALSDLALLDQISPTFIYYESKLLKEAIAQKNIFYQSTATYAILVHYYNKLDQKHTEQWLAELEKIAEENNYYNHYFKGRRILIELYIMNQKIELALKESQEMYEKAVQLKHSSGMREAYLCQMTGYFSTMRYAEGLAALNKAIALTGSDVSTSDKLDMLPKAILAYSHLHDNVNLLKMLTQLEQISQTFPAPSHPGATNRYDNLFLLMELQYSIYYTRNQEAEKAWEHLEKAKLYVTPSSFPPYQLLLRGAYAEYYQLTKENEKALDHLDQAIDFVRTLSTEDMQTYSLQKAALLVDMGRPEKALPLYKQITKSKDSLYTVFASSQIEQIQSLYNMDKLLLMKEEREIMFHRICLILSIIFVIILIHFNLRMYRSRKHLEEDEKEMRRLVNIAEEANEMKGHFLANMSYNIRIPLNNVVGFSQLLSSDIELEEKERQEYSSIVQSNSSSLIQLVNDVLDLSRLEANMMKFQLQECSIEEWCSEIKTIQKIRSEGSINLLLQAESGDGTFSADTNRLNQVVLSTLLYPIPCPEVREVRMVLQYQPELHIITCRIENSPMADSRFTSQKTSIQQRINQLFFEHFEGSYEVVNAKETEVGFITFTYPTLS